MMRQQSLLISFLILCSFTSLAQVSLGDKISVDYANPREYVIGGVNVEGIQYLDHSVLVMLSGLTVGETIQIPGEEITEAIRKLWQQGLFEDIRISVTHTDGELAFLQISLKERPRLSKFSFTGVRKGEADKLRDEIKIMRGDVVTDYVMMTSTEKIRRYFINKGFLNVDVAVKSLRDTAVSNSLILDYHIEKNRRVKINQVVFHGNEELGTMRLKSALKETKDQARLRPFAILDSLLLGSVAKLLHQGPRYFPEWISELSGENIRIRIFKSSKFIESDFESDKKRVVEKYNEQGFRDAAVVRDSIIRNTDGTIDLHVYVDEGNKYYFRNITWVGNTKYPSSTLDAILGVEKGDVYNQKKLDANLSFNPSGFDVSSLYLDDGYLFFQLIPVETAVVNDSIDIEIRLREGKQATINKVTVKGNTKTNDHVILREIRTRPGQMFSRSDIIRTTRELAQLRYFNPEKINPVPSPNPADGTVDIEYEVEETSADQIELSGGWGYGRVVGTLGLSFNNFSIKNMFKRDAWRPVPSGDGQKLSVRLQSYGTGYVSYSASFTEPWLGGKKPNAFSVSYYHSLYSNGLGREDTNRSAFVIDGVTIGLGKRLSWPDDFFTLYTNASYQRYKLSNYRNIFAFSNGTANNISATLSLSRNSIDAPIYPRTGSEISLSLQATPPYSLFSDTDYGSLSEAEKYKWIEYHKWNFNMAWYTRLAGDLVLRTRARYGFLGTYNQDLGVTIFERFYLGGDGLSGYNNLDGREIIGMRGYSNESLTPDYYRNSNLGGTIYSKYTMELRYPVSLNPNATIYVMSFLEAGNAWLNFKSFDPFEVKRSAGFGLRVYLPMFGILGLDWGYGFDDIPGLPNANKGQFHFSINQSID
jgi:outer membrane protein insertion porin family